jgi:hypothetical protein
MLVTKTSLLTNKQHSREIDITQEQLTHWEEGRGLIQVLMPHLSADDREFLMTGSTPEEWEASFGGDD